MRKRNQTRFIGNTEVMEISFPNYPKFNIYADTETCTIFADSVKPGAEPDTAKRNELLRSLTQCPGLLVGTHRSIRKEDNTYVIEGDGIKNYSFVDENFFEPFFDCLRRIYANHHIPVIYFHNASYDLSCIFNIGQKLDPGLIVYFYTKPGNYNFLMGEMESPKYKFKAKFGDTMLYLGKISIEKMGDELGIPKGEGVPYTMGNVLIKDEQIIYTDTIDGETKTFPLDKYLEYAHRDVEIMRRYDEYLDKVKESVGRTVIPNEDEYKKAKRGIGTKTQASHSKNLCDQYLRNTEYKTTIDKSCRFEVTKEEYQYIAPSNIGGFTSFNQNIAMYRCSDDEEIRYMDMNSMYPTVITEGIPWKPLLNIPPLDKPYVTGKLISVSKVKGNSLMDFNKTQPIPNEKISPVDSHDPIKFYVTEDYLNFIKKYTSVLEMKEYHTVYQEKTDVFKKFVDDLYRKRTELKKEKKELEAVTPQTQHTIARIEQLDTQQTGIKIVLNSLYGKFCEKPYHNRCFYSNLSDFKFVRYAIDNPTFRCILSGAYIIYEARLKLLNKIVQCAEKGGRVLYADTDSVVFVCPKTADHTPVFGTDDGGLGQGKEEWRGNIFVNSGVKKKYFLMDDSNPKNYKKAMSGVNKEFVKALEKQLKAGNKQTIEDIIFIFDPNNNVILRKLKKNKVRTHVYNQTILYESDYTFNGKKPVNGEVKVSNGEYKLIKYEQQD